MCHYPKTYGHNCIYILFNVILILISMHQYTRELTVA